MRRNRPSGLRRHSHRSGLARSNGILLPGSSGDYAATPDSVAASITDNFTLVCCAAFDDWSSPGALIAKWTSGKQSYILDVPFGDRLRLYVDDNGLPGGEGIAASDASFSFVDEKFHWSRATFSGGSVDFYTSDDSPFIEPQHVSWTQLGTTRTVSGGVTSAANTTAEVSIGAYNLGATSRATGKVSRAVVINSTDPTAAAVVDFKPRERDVGLKSWVSTTGETWTLNGNSRLI